MAVLKTNIPEEDTNVDIKFNDIKKKIFTYSGLADDLNAKPEFTNYFLEDTALPLNGVHVRHKAGAGGPICYISSALSNERTSTFDFFCTLLSEIVWNIESSENPRDVVIKIPDSNTITDSDFSQDKILRSVLLHISSYSAIIIAPVVSGAIRDVLRDTLEEIGLDVLDTCPVLAVEKPIGDFIVNSTKVAIPSVVSDWIFGGQLVGRFIASRLGGHGGRVLVLNGLEGSIERIAGLVYEVKSRKVHIDITNSLSFSREAAMEFVLDFASKFRGSKKKLTMLDYDFIFACNDEMAIGAKEALQYLADSDRYRDMGVRVIGFDGTNEFTKILQKGSDRFLERTVDVKMADQAKLVTSMLDSELPGSHLKTVRPIMLGL